MIAACSKSSSSNFRSRFLSGVFCKEPASAVTFLDLGEGGGEERRGGERGRKELEKEGKEEREGGREGARENREREQRKEGERDSFSK